MKMQQGIIKGMLEVVKTYLVFLLLLLLVCCNKKLIQVDHVSQIRFWAMEKGIEPIIPLGWEDVLVEGRDTIITNRDFIEPFVDLLNHLHREKKDFISDKRSVAIIEMQSGDSIIVAFGERGGIHLNGSPMRNDPQIISFIDEYVYGPHEHDVDYWYPGEKRRFIAYLRDFFHRLDSTSVQ